MSNIPVIDFQNFLGSDKHAIANEFTEACRTNGFVYLKNFGISQEKLDRMFKTSKKFFDSDLAVKKSVSKKISFIKDNVTFCGYDEMEFENLSAERPGDLKESFMCKQDGTPWPVCKELEEYGFKEELLEFHSECYLLGFKLVHALALGLNLPETILDKNFNGEVALLRLLHYPPILKPILPNQLRCGEHSDYGALTLLFQDPVGGLEIKQKNGQWLPAPFIQGSVIVNIGDCMEIWTNGYLKSTPHRVANPEGDRVKLSRYSIVFFFDPDLECELKSLDKYKDRLDVGTELRAMNYKEHVLKKFSYTYPSSYKY